MGCSASTAAAAAIAVGASPEALQRAAADGVKEAVPEGSTTLLASSPAKVDPAAAMATPSVVATKELPHTTVEDLMRGKEEGTRVEEASSPLHFKNLLMRAHEQARKVVCLSFTRSRDPACAAATRVCAALSSKHTHVPFVQVDPDMVLVPLDSLLAEFGIQTYPTMVVLVDFQVAGRLESGDPQACLSFLQGYLDQAAPA